MNGISTIIIKEMVESGEEGEFFFFQSLIGLMVRRKNSP